MLTTFEAKLEYANIIRTARNRITDVGELHHIKPRAFGGTNIKDNLVKLTFIEHYRCHLLLCYMFVDERKNKMIFAWNQMSNRSKGEFVNENEYSFLKTEYTRILSKMRTGTTQTEETKQKISESLKNRKVSLETCKNISNACKKKARVECPYCSKVCDISNAKRWHFEKCKFKVYK